MTDLIVGNKLKDYFMSHVKETKNKNFYKVVKPLYVFKKTISSRRRYCITNLIIPKGAIIYCCAGVFDYYNLRDNRKMRASRAIVHSSARISSARIFKTDNTRSFNDRSFIYKNGKTVTPRFKFSMKNAHCDSGIHFFLNLQDAINY